MSTENDNNNFYQIKEISEDDIDLSFFLTLKNLADVELIKTDIKKSKEILTTILQSNTKIFVAKNVMNEIIGSITIIIEQKFIHNGGKVGHIEDVVTRKGYENKGIGRSLVKTAIEFAKKNKCYKIILNCNKDNILFYKKLGFVQTEVEMRYDL